MNIKGIFRRLLDLTLAPLVRYIYFTVSNIEGSTRQIQDISPEEPRDRSVPQVNVSVETKPHQRSVIDECWDRAAVESADYAALYMADAVQFSNRDELRDFAWKKRPSSGLIAEFGVCSGYTINRFAAQTTETIYGFDSFEGLREDWRGGDLGKGHFSLNGELPSVKPNVTLIKGWFNGTIPTFVKEHPEPYSFVHIDSDTYEAAKEVLRNIGPYLKAGTVILFDEYFGYRGWKKGEYLAWQEFVKEHNKSYKYLGFSVAPVAIVLL